MEAETKKPTSFPGLFTQEERKMVLPSFIGLTGFCQASECEDSCKRVVARTLFNACVSVQSPSQSLECLKGTFLRIHEMIGAESETVQARGVQVIEAYLEDLFYPFHEELEMATAMRDEAFNSIASQFTPPELQALSTTTERFFVDRPKRDFDEEALHKLVKAALIEVAVKGPTTAHLFALLSKISQYKPQKDAYNTAFHQFCQNLLD